MIEIFVNGIQRSGTNYVRQLLQANTDHEVHERVSQYWKHDAFNGTNPECDSIVCVIKNPYTWVESICFRNCVDIIIHHSQVYNEQETFDDKIHSISATKIRKELGLK